MQYKPHEFAEMLGVTVKTLQRWDKQGILKAYRTPTHRRFYTPKQYSDYMDRSSTAKDNEVETKKK
jgi:putative resolvase